MPDTTQDGARAGACTPHSRRSKTMGSHAERPARTDTGNESGRIDWRDWPHVERDPEIMSGAWCFEGTTLPVSTLFINLASGRALAPCYPRLRRPWAPVGSRDKHVMTGDNDYDTPIEYIRLTPNARARTGTPPRGRAHLDTLSRPLTPRRPRENPPKPAQSLRHGHGQQTDSHGPDLRVRRPQLPRDVLRDLQEALRTGPTMVEIDAEEAAAFQGVRHHFDHPKVPDPETLSDEPTPGPEWTQILLELGGDDPARRAVALQHVLTSGTCGWKRSPTTDDSKKAVKNAAPDKRQTMALHEWADTAGWRMLALGWAHGLYTPRVAGVGAPPDRAVEMPGSGPPEDGGVRADPRQTRRRIGTAATRQRNR